MADKKELKARIKRLEGHIDYLEDEIGYALYVLDRWELGGSAGDFDDAIRTLKDLVPE